MNVGQSMEEAVKAVSAQFSDHLENIEMELKEEWNRHWAIINVHMMEEYQQDEYTSKDYDQLRSDVIEALVQQFPAKLFRRDNRCRLKKQRTDRSKPCSRGMRGCTVNHNNKPKTGYILEVHGKSIFFNFEFEVYSAAWSERNRKKYNQLMKEKSNGRLDKGRRATARS